MPKPVDLNFAIGLPPEKAIAYFKSKGYAFSWDWHDVWQDAHNKAFTVAKAMRMDVLQDIHNAVQNSLEQGQTFQQFKKDLTPKLQAKGWWGRKLVGSTTEAGKTAGATEVQLGSPARLKTIYQTNMQTSYMAGRYNQQANMAADRPNWMYVAVMDARTRPAHAALNGRVFRHDDPFWQTHYPPNGFNCRCRVRVLSDTALKRSGAQVESSAGNMSTTYEPLNKTSNEMVPVTTYHDPVTGMDIAPDKGWSYCPGRDDLNPMTLEPSTAPYKDVGGVTYKKPSVHKLPKRIMPDSWFDDEGLSPSNSLSSFHPALIDSFLRDFGALTAPVVYEDIVGDPVVISRGMFDIKKAADQPTAQEQYLPMLADTIKHPTEVWMTFVKDDKGNEKLCKRYIGVYKDKKGNLTGYAVYDIVNGTWNGVTSFDPSKDLSSLDKLRTGTLIFPKSIKR